MVIGDTQALRGKKSSNSEARKYPVFLPHHVLALYMSVLYLNNTCLVRAVITSGPGCSKTG